jgi:predicted enzyme related to lactoylglutathione lyase
VAAFKDLCIDAVDDEAMTQFWGEVLGLTIEERGRDRFLTGPTPQHTVWINRVPEPVSVKQRVHLDVVGPSDEWLAGLGATPRARFPGWSVWTDPEGGELCLFVRPHVSRGYRLYELGVDCGLDAEAIARWWGEVFGATVGRTGDPSDDEWYAWIKDVPGMPFDAIVFVPVPEPKTVKNRVHWDVTTNDVAALVAAGARVLREPDDEVRWTVLADPVGNEFCAFAS